MNPIFDDLLWSFDLPPPWRIQKADDRFEVTQPEGAGVMEIRHVRKEEGSVLESETSALLKDACPSGTVCEKVRCGDFVGYVASYVDWACSRSWRVWFVACGSNLLHIVYTCWRGEETLEADEASALLLSLRSRA